MPTVPGSKGPQVALGVTPDARRTLPTVAAPDVRLDTPTINLPGVRTPQLDARQVRPVVNDPEAMRRVRVSDRGAGQLVAMGQNLAGVSDALGRQALDFQVKVNATVVDDALNDARETARKLTWGVSDGKGGLTGGYKTLKGYDAIKRPSGKALDDEVAEEFDNSVKAIVKSKLSNADQRRAFEMQVNDLSAQLRQGATTWQSEQFDSYHTGVYQGMVSNLTQEFALRDPTDLAGQKAAMVQIESAVATLANNKGASEQEMQVGQRAARGAAVKSLFDGVMAEKKYGVAQALLNEWGEKIDANTATQMKLGLDGRVSIQLGEQLANEAWRSWAAPSYQAGDADRAFNVVLHLETRGKHVGDNGRVMTSSKGAYGIAQTIPETAEAMAKKLGRPELAEIARKPTKEGEAASLLLGKTYFNELVQQFKGDVPKALAAYNAGPGMLVGGKDRRGNKLEGAINKAARLGGDWRDYLPAETKAYVANGMRAYGAGEGVPAKPSKQQLLDAIDARSDDPDVRRAAYTWLDKRFSAAEMDEREGYEDAYASGLRVVRETGGNLNAVPPELKARIRPDQYTQLQAYAKSMAEGQYTATKPEAYYTAMIAANNPATTVNQIEAMRPDLSETDYNAVRNQFIERRAPQPGKGPDSLDTSTLDSIVDTRLQYLGINTKPGKDDKDAMARLGAIRQFTHQYVLDMQRQTGTKFTDYKQLQDITNQMFTRSQEFKTTWAGVKTGGGSQTVLTSGVKDIPADTRQRVTSQLEKHLGRKPSDAEVLQAYFRSQFYAGGSSGR